MILQPEPFTLQSEPVVKADFSAAQKEHKSEPVNKDLFVPFTVGDIKVIQSTPDHKPPTQEDTIEGRYASVLFTSAS